MSFARVDIVRKHIVVIGGGFSGTVLAAQLIRRAPHLSLAVIDKSPVPGRGLAYGTEYDCHLLNVCAEDMTAFPEEPQHFANWAQKNYALPVQQRSFLPRAFYGKYLGSVLDEAHSRSRVNFDWLQDEVLSAKPAQDGFVVRRKNGSVISAQAVVLAMGNFPPGNLGIPGLTATVSRYERMAWSKSALENLSDNDEVLLIGSGLTSVDIAIALQSRGFKGKIHILSRHGLLPQCHKQSTAWPNFWNERSPKTVRGLMRLIRTQAAAAAELGSDWRAVIDSLRPLVQQIWQSLPMSERRRFLRHVRSYWEVHRHRVAPEISERFAGMIASRQIQVIAGRITQYSEQGDSARVTFRRREINTIDTLQVARVINCSGPEADCRKVESVLLADLFAEGLVRRDVLGLGLDVDEKGGLLDSNGASVHSLFALGSVRKGFLWESTAVPELRVQAAELAKHLCAILPKELKERSSKMLTAQ